MYIILLKAGFTSSAPFDIAHIGKSICSTIYIGNRFPIMVRVTGLEPARLKALEPKSSASANSAIPASKVIIHLFRS